MSQQKIQKILNSMKKNMDCPICLDLMTNPVSTTCNHHFCKFCIIEFIQKKRHVPCPLCNVALTKRSFQENSKLKNIIEKLKNLLSAVAKDTCYSQSLCKENWSLPNLSLPAKRGIKRKINSIHKSEVQDVESTQLNGEKLTKGKDNLSTDGTENIERQVVDEKKEDTDCVKISPDIEEYEPVDLEIQSKDVNMPSSFLHTSDENDSDSDLSSLSRLVSETKSCSSIKSASRFNNDSLISSPVELVISDKIYKTNKGTFHEDTNEYLEPFHISKKRFTGTENLPKVDDTILPCNSSNASTSNKQMNTEENCNDAYKETISPMQSLEMPCKTNKSQTISNDNKSLSNFLIIPDFKLVDYTPTQSSVMSEDNIKLNDYSVYSQIKETVLSQDLERNNEMQLNTEKNIQKVSISLLSKDSLCELENVEDISQNNTLLEEALKDKNIRLSNSRSDENLPKNSNSLSIESSPLFSSNSKVDDNEIYESLEASQQNNSNENLIHSDNKKLTPFIMNSSQDKDSKSIVSEFDPEAKHTIPETNLEKMYVLDSQGSSSSIQLNLIECQPSSITEIPCSVDLENNDVNILPELHKLYQNETPETDRKETSEVKVVFNNELCSKNLPLQLKYQKDRSVKNLSTTIPETIMFPTDRSTLDSQVVIQTKTSKRKCFSLDGKCLKSVFSNKDFNCESEISDSSTKDNLIDCHGNEEKTEVNCISLDGIKQPFEEKKKQRSENLFDPVVSLKVKKCPRKRRKSNEKNSFEMKYDSLKDSASIGNQPKETFIPDEITEEKYLDPSSVSDTCEDSLTQAPSSDRETLELLTDKTISPLPFSPTPCSITTDVTSEPIITRWSQQEVPQDNDGQNNFKKSTLTKSKEIQVFQDTDIENSDPLLPVDKGIDIKPSERIQNLISNLEDSDDVVNISQKSQESNDELTLNTMRNDDSTENHSELSQTKTIEPKEDINTTSLNIDTLKTSNNIEIESQRNLLGAQKEGSPQLKPITSGNITVDTSSQLDVPPPDVNLSIQKNGSQVTCNSSNIAEVASHIQLSNEKTELQKDTNSFVEKSTQSSKQAEQSDEEESSNINNKNTRGSENLGSQNEKYTTQLCAYLENDLVEMKRQIALLEAKLGMDDSSVNEEDDCGNELKLPSCQETETPVSDVDLIKISKSDNKYMRLSSDEEDVIPDSFQEEPSSEVEKCLSPDDSKKSATEDSEELFFSLPFQRSPSASYYPKTLNGKKRSQRDHKNHLQYKAKSKKRVPVIESDESDVSFVLADEDRKGSVDREEVIPSDMTGKDLPENKSHKHLKKKRKKSIKCEPCRNFSNLFEFSSTNVDCDEKHEEVRLDVLSTNRLRQIKNLVTTGLSNIDVHKVKQFCENAGYKFSLQFSSEVTHVIVRTVSPQVRYCDRTLKYFQGIAHKCWVVSFQWVEQSLKSDTTLKEADFEITGDTVNGKHHRGPTRSRLSNINLLTSYQIYFTGETSELSLGVLGNLVKTVGGTLVTNPECFDLKSKKTCLIISSGNQESHKLAKNLCKKNGVLLLSREWLLDSIAMYEIQSLDGYILL